MIGLGNCCCGAWILFGGGLAAYLLQQDNPNPITVGDGAIAGLMAGVFGAIAWTIVSIPVQMLLAGFNQAALQRVMNNTNDMPPEFRAFLEGLSQSGATGIGLGITAIFFMIVMLFICSLWAMVGGVFGALMFKKNTPPPPPPPTFNPATFAPPPPPGSN